MNWSWLLVLICPLMMILMMFGMFGGKGHGHGRGHKSSGETDSRVLDELQEVKHQNERLSREIRELQAQIRPGQTEGF